METVGGVNNWKLTLRREGEGVTLARAVTCDIRAALPETVLGLPVTALGEHALSPGAREEPGEEVLVSCGPLPEDAAWDNRNLRDLTLPEGLRRVGDYAFLNCGGLRKLRLYDGVAFWGGGALMNCRVLNTVEITRTGPEGDALAYFADELSRELDATVFTPDGTARLLFPEFAEVYEENCPAHHFDYAIYGAGYPYHHCFRQKRLNLKDYDALWPGYLGMEHDESCALRLAWWRVRRPLGLSDRAAALYWAYLRARGGETVQWLLEQADTAGLAFFLSRAKMDDSALSAACALARDRGAAEALALLLEAQHRRNPAGAEKRFDL